MLLLRTSGGNTLTQVKTIHWRKWDEVMESKMEGGLRFKELQSFNMILLTKMSAQILAEPNTLFVRVLKGIYFRNGEFLEASKERQSWREDEMSHYIGRGSTRHNEGTNPAYYMSG